MPKRPLRPAAATAGRSVLAPARLAALCVLALGAALASLLAPTPASAGELVVANGRVILPIYHEAPAAYFVIQNRGAEPRTIVGASSPRCNAISIRRAAVVDGRMSSVELPSMEIPAGGAVAFAPRGLFLELAATDVLAAGEVFPIELALADGEKLAFEAIVAED